jgi:RNA polymerase sigma-54 factor
MAGSMKLQPQLAAKHVLTQMLHRSLEILQLPQLELAALILEEVEKNPLLELESNSVLEPYITSGPVAPDSLYHRLSAEMREALPGEEALGRQLIAHLDEHGFLCTPFDELCASLHVSPAQLEPILRTLKTFDPPGVFAKDTQEALLIQLDRKEQQNTLAFRLIQEAYADLLAGRYAKLKKQFRITSRQLQAALEQIRSLKTRPIEPCTQEASCIYPDLRAQQVDGAWKVELWEEGLPKFRWNEKYLALSTKDPIVRGFLTTAKWLLRSIQRRKELLLSIGRFVVRKQEPFFEGQGSLRPLSAGILAIELGVHESTIFRAVSGKYMESPLGVMPMHYLISPPPNRSVKEVLCRLITQENKPLTDEILSHELAKSGFKIARRTVAKYRKELKLGSSSRRIFHEPVSQDEKGDRED